MSFHEPEANTATRLDPPRRAPSTRALALAAARSALPFVVVAATLSGLALPPLLDRVLPRVLPEVSTERKVLGLFSARRVESNPHIPTARRLLLTMAWLATVAGGAALAIRAARRTGEESWPEPPPAGREVLPSMSIPARAPAPAAGSPFDVRYILEGEIGRGGMGVVHVARDTTLGRRVAVKELAAPGGAPAGFVDRFRQEARALARLTHPNIVQVHDLLEEDTRFRMVIELAEGGNLAEGIARHGPLAPPEAARVFADVARGLAFAHAQGVVHRDVKPANILFAKDGTPKIADFGLAKLAGDGGTTLAGSVLGSPAYLSPEQASGGEAGPASDVYSLGVALFEAVTGARPFDGAVVSLLARHLHDEPPRLETRTEAVPAALADLVAAMLAKDPAARPALADVIARLDAIAGSPAQES